MNKTTRHITSLPTASNNSKDGFRKKAVKLKTARGRKNSSQRWLQRQLNDPYVQQAQSCGYRSRAAFKLLEIQEKFKIISNNTTIIDLGSAPGGWSQIITDTLSKTPNNHSKIIAIDLLDMDPIDGVTFIKGDFLDIKNKQQLIDLTNNKVDLVVSDMAASTTGHPNTDHLRTNLLVESAFMFAKSVLKHNGTFVSKVFAGGAHKELLDELKIQFNKIKHFKPHSSRKESPETYIICQGFKNNP